MQLLFHTVWQRRKQTFFHKSGVAGIGPLSPNPSSLLERRSTAKGFPMSRMTKAQRDAIASPATGLMIYQTNNIPGFYYASTPAAGAYQYCDGRLMATK